MSFFYSSELSVTVLHPQLAKGTRIRLLKEHLGGFYRPAMAETDNFCQVFNAFSDVASRNSASLRANGTLVGRPVSMAPDTYQFILNKVYYPNKLSKFLSKTAGWDTEDMWIKLRSRIFSRKPDASSGRPIAATLPSTTTTTTAAQTGTEVGSGASRTGGATHLPLKSQL